MIGRTSLNPAGIVRLDRSWPWLGALRPELAVLVNRLSAEDLAQGTLATVQGNPYVASVGDLGPCVHFDGTGDALEWSLARRTSHSGLNITIAAIMRSDESVASSRRFAGTSSTTNAGYHIEYDAAAAYTNQLVFTKGGVVNVVSTVLLNDFQTYFTAVSHRISDGTTHFVARSLSTGTLQRDTQTDTQAGLTGDGIYNIGGSRVFSSAMFLGWLGMGVIGVGFLPMSALVEWAENPYGIFATPERAVRGVRAFRRNVYLGTRLRPRPFAPGLAR